jgi:hypothetical protein
VAYARELGFKPQWIMRWRARSEFIQAYRRDAKVLVHGARCAPTAPIQRAVMVKETVTGSFGTPT